MIFDEKEVTVRKALLFPKFYYCGNRFEASDRDYIEARLSTLSQKNRIIASENYTQIYLGHLNKKQARKARLEANRYINEVAKSHGISRAEFLEAREESTKNKETRHKFVERIEQIKRMKPSILRMAEGKA